MACICLRRFGVAADRRGGADGPRSWGGPGGKRRTTWKNSFVGGGLRDTENGIGSGAQTQRRGDAMPVRALLGGEGLTGRLSPLRQVVRALAAGALLFRVRPG